MAMRFALELGMKSMASQKHHFIAIVSNLKMGFVAQSMVMMVSYGKEETIQRWVGH